MAAFWIYLIQNGHFKDIEHKFPMSGHSYLPWRPGLWSFEKSRENHSVYLPENWMTSVEQSRRRSPLYVLRMTQVTFVTIQSVVKSKWTETWQQLVKRWTFEELVGWNFLTRMRFKRSTDTLTQWNIRTVKGSFLREAWTCLYSKGNGQEVHWTCPNSSSQSWRPKNVGQAEYDRFYHTLDLDQQGNDFDTEILQTKRKGTFQTLKGHKENTLQCLML